MHVVYEFIHDIPDTHLVSCILLLVLNKKKTRGSIKVNTYTIHYILYILAATVRKSDTFVDWML